MTSNPPKNAFVDKTCFPMEGHIYRLEEENLASEYVDVFEGLGEIKGIQHKIQIDPNATPFVHPPPHRVPVALCEPLNEELQRMEKLVVIKKCTEPVHVQSTNAWVHSLVVARKKNN